MTENFPFFSLPGELRNMIYCLALSSEERFFLTGKINRSRSLVRHCAEYECMPQFPSARYHRDFESASSLCASFSPNVSLLTVSRAVHAEAISFLYRQHIVVADNYKLAPFLNQIGPRHVKMLRIVTVRSWHGGRFRYINFPAMALLASATNLKRLNIEHLIGYIDEFELRNGKAVESLQRMAQKLFQDCYPVIEAIIMSTGSIKAGVDLITVADKNFTFNYYSWRARRNMSDLIRRKNIDENIKVFRDEIQRLLQD